MKSKSILCSLFAMLVLLPFAAICQEAPRAAVWLTTQNRSSLFAKQPDLLHFSRAENNSPTIAVNDKEKFQSVDGFGFAMTDGSAQLLMQMGQPERSVLLRRLFSTQGADIGASYLRLTIGASDMNANVFSYDDMPAGETDPDLKKFSLAPDGVNLIPVLKEVLAINPRIKFLASPWSAPPWMKTNDSAKGGHLKPEYYKAYANYLVKYIEGMKAAGITIDTITVQNEPLNPKNTPSMVMFANEEGQFIKNDLGPAFQKAGIQTKILLYDHNPDVPSYVLSILKDPGAAKYVDGSAWHLYGGDISALSEVHDAFPDKKIYFTEQTITEPPGSSSIDIAEPVSGVVIGATRNWSRNVLLWNLAADPNDGPHTNDGGCTMCQGAITLDGNKVTFNISYYVVAHFSKFVRPGSVRIASNHLDQLDNVTFLTPTGKIVLVVANTSNFAKTFNIAFHGKMTTASLPIGAVATYIW
ncbi:MAG: glycoside hydrolase family 30 beta sandwich domain-containing protein [Acidobacteriaceae bacterium]